MGVSARIGRPALEESGSGRWGVKMVLIRPIVQATTREIRRKMILLFPGAFAQELGCTVQAFFHCEKGRLFYVFRITKRTDGC